VRAVVGSQLYPYPPTMIRILIFEDNAQLSEGLTLLLNTVDDFQVAGCFKNLNTLEKEIMVYSPDIVLMDISFPSGSGIDGLRQIKRINASIKVLMLTGMADEASVFESLKSGADGYLLKKTSPVKLLESVREAYEGGAPMTPSIARQVLATFSANHPLRDTVENLTVREKEVLKLLVNGLSYKMVSSDLNISIDTVRSHIRNIYEKLHVNSKSEAVAKAILNQIV
jgi:DNA-binding NarL/FixJ family response regulator